MFPAFLIGMIFLAVGWRIFGGRPKSVTLLEYQRGVLYRRGMPIREAGTGRHIVFSGIDKILILDARPIQVSYEDQVVALRDGSMAVYALSGAARVKEARKAIYSAANYNHVPAFVMLCCTRSALNRHNVTQLNSREAAAEMIAEEIKARLTNAGFELISFRLNQLSVAERTIL